MPTGVYKHKKASKITRKKMSKSHKGMKKPWAKDLPHLFKEGVSHGVGKDNPSWKGDKVGYRALHRWLEKKLGKPHFCEECGNKKLSHRQYHWANISGKYKRNIDDWRRLCVKCHKKFDKK